MSFQNESSHKLPLGLDMTANFSVKKSLGHHDFAYDIVAESHSTLHKCVQGSLNYSPGVHLAV